MCVCGGECMGGGGEVCVCVCGGGGGGVCVYAGGGCMGGVYGGGEVGVQVL